MRYLNITVFAVAVELLAGISLHAATPEGRGFASPNAAAKALISAAKSDDVTDLIAILGPASKEILSTNDPVADQQMRRKFIEQAAAKMKLVPDPKKANAQTLLIGKDEWPLPIPIVKDERRMAF
jgi:Protein of unknown function (DUF2950)